jgi:hypothetical protein
MTEAKLLISLAQIVSHVFAHLKMTREIIFIVTTNSVMTAIGW